MQQQLGQPPAPHRSPLGLRRDAVPTAPTPPGRRLRRAHLQLASKATAASIPPLRPSQVGALPSMSARSTPTPTRQPPMAPPATPAMPAMPAPPPKPRIIQSMIYCASIQDRPVWAPAIPLLLSAGATGPRWEKARLSSHDLAVRIGPSSDTGAGPDTASSSSSTTTTTTFRFALVTAADVELPQTTQKLQRLAARENGKTAVVLFLLSRGSSDEQGGSVMAAYRQLQQRLQTTSVSILPLTAVEALPATVAAFCEELTAPPVQTPRDISRGRLHNVVRMYLGRPVPLSAAGAQRLVAACEAELRRPSIGLKDVVAFCNTLKKRGRGQLQAILEPEDMARLSMDHL